MGGGVHIVFGTLVLEDFLTLVLSSKLLDDILVLLIGFRVVVGGNGAK